MGQGPAGGFRELGELVRLHAEHPAAFEATLIERGLRWREVGTDGFTWSDCWAVISNLPYDAPLTKAINGADWWWYHPVVDFVVGSFDYLGVIAAVVQRRPKLKRDDVPKRTVRPWERRKETEVLKVKPSKLDDLRKLLGWD